MMICLIKDVFAKIQIRSLLIMRLSKDMMSMVISDSDDFPY